MTYPDIFLVIYQPSCFITAHSTDWHFLSFLFFVMYSYNNFKVGIEFHFLCTHHMMTEHV